MEMQGGVGILKAFETHSNPKPESSSQLARRCLILCLEFVGPIRVQCIRVSKYTNSFVECFSEFVPRYPFTS